MKKPPPPPAMDETAKKRIQAAAVARVTDACSAADMRVEMPTAMVDVGTDRVRVLCAVSMALSGLKEVGE
jgi:hypothetical protein